VIISASTVLGVDLVDLRLDLGDRHARVEDRHVRPEVGQGWSSVAVDSPIAALNASRSAAGHETQSSSSERAADVLGRAPIEAAPCYAEPSCFESGIGSRRGVSSSRSRENRRPVVKPAIRVSPA
jgi:hypothetical protein